MGKAQTQTLINKKSSGQTPELFHFDYNEWFLNRNIIFTQRIVQRRFQIR